MPLYEGAQSAYYPSFTQDFIRAAIDAGKGFQATTGLVAAPSASTFPVSFFSPNTSTKKKVIYSVRFYCSAGTTGDFRFITADPTGGWSGTSSLSIINSLQSGGASADAGTVITTTNTAAQTLGGTVIDGLAIATLNTADFIQNNGLVEIPAAFAGGIEVGMKTTGTNNYLCTIKWLEL